MKVAVLGGGFAGILTARTLLARGYDPHVFESSDRIGGLCRSDTVDGFVHDVAGGHILHSRNRAVLDSMVSTIGDTVERRRDTRIFYRGDYVKYPFENGLADLPAADNYDCLKGYVDAYMKRGDGAGEPESFRDWITWRFGEGIARHFMFPYNEKIWCSDLRDISSAWCSGRVPDAPLDDVLKASLGIDTEGYTHQLSFHYPRTGGFQTLVDAYAVGLERCIRTSTPVTELAEDAGGFRVNGEGFDRIVNTMPLAILLRVLHPAPPAPVVEACAALKHLSLSTVLVAVDGADLSPYCWVYLPHPENGPMNRITFLHNYSDANVPDGCSSILAEVTSPGGAGPPDLAALEATIVEKLEDMKMLPASRVRFTRSSFSEYAYPVHDIGFPERIAAVLGWLETRKVVSLGRFARYAYVNTDQVYEMVSEALADDFHALA